MPAGSSYHWRAFSPDGLTYYFGGPTSSGCSIISDGYAPLTSVTDAFGNLIEYTYRRSDDNLGASECRLQQVDWGGSTDPLAGVQHFARVALTYTGAYPKCGGVPIGALTSYRTGVKIYTGASKLDSIVVTAYPPGSPSTPVHTRTITLAYSSTEMSCTATHAAYRSLTSIQETAVGTDSPQVVLPAVTFTYNSASIGVGTLAYQTPAQKSLPWSTAATAAYNLGWGQRYPTGAQWPTVEAMIVDVDGDGLPDRLTNKPITDGSGHTTACGASWERNLGGGIHFAAPQPIPMPSLKWMTNPGNTTNYYSGGAFAGDGGTNAQTEGCYLNYQLTFYTNSHNPGAVQCPPGDTVACGPAGYCTVSGDYGTDCAALTPQSRTTLAFRWQDIDGDGRIDLIASPAEGGYLRYNFQWGNGAPGYIPQPSPESPSPFGTFPNCPATSYTGDTSGRYTMCNGMYPWMIYKNKGHGQFGLSAGAAIPDTILYEPVPLEPSSGKLVAEFLAGRA